MTRWTEADLPDLRGKTALVTGANSGLGLETSRALASRGAHVILACRGADKAQAAMASIRERVPNASLEALSLDLSNLLSVRAAATAFKAAHATLDLLINNAGVMTLPYGKTRDGFEMLFGTNHLGHFALTGLLLDVLRATPGARVVTVSSVAHKSGRLALDDLHWERRKYSRGGAYGQSKLANLMFMLELDRRLRRAGIDVLSVAAHPGYAATNIVFGGSAATPSPLRRIWNRLAAIGNLMLAQPAALGALPTLYAATAPGMSGGEYVGPHGPLEFRGYPVVVRPARHALDEGAAKRLWALSEEMTGVRLL
jgi:NAD(P)-dependent dehydrogenase (short-subunit alcohol dehydrogenase family)